MNILTIDIEDWFHLLDFAGTKEEKNWLSFESRLETNLYNLLDLLANKKTPATFFCLGWIASKYPHLIKEVSRRGYEIGSHSNMHGLIYEMTEKEFSNDLYISIDTIEQLIGKKVIYYRAPGFSIKRNNLWAIDILTQQGIIADSSIFPATRAHGGISGFYNKPFTFHNKHSVLKELPISTSNIFFKNYAFSGGGYFRFFPYNLIKHYTLNSNYVMTYFHPRDFDTNQPIIKGLNPIKKFKAYFGLNSALQKFEYYITDFKFINISEAINQIDWKKQPICHI